MKQALVFGASGQIGSYLCELLLEKGYEVTGTYCRHLRVGWTRKPCLSCVDISDRRQVRSIMSTSSRWDEIYNMASLMYAPDSWSYPREYVAVNGAAVVDILDHIGRHYPECRYFQAGSAEVFDIANHCPQNEMTPIKPRNPYGVAKAMAQDMVRVYREHKNLFACTGIFFNAESLRRADTFFSVKVAKAVAAIAAGKQDKLTLGKLSAYRDWGYAPEYAEAAWMMLQASKPDDYVIGTGETHSCLAFVELACQAAGIDFHDKVTYANIGYDQRDVLQADPSKIGEHLGWRAKTRFGGLIDYLVSKEMASIGQGTVVR